MLLGVISDPQTVSGLDLPGVRAVDAGKHAQQGGLSGAIQPEHDDFGAAVDGEVDRCEDLERPVALREVARLQRRPSARRGGREAQLRDPVDGADILEPGEELLGACHHLMGGRRLARLGAELRRLQLQDACLLLGVGPLLLTAFLVGGALALVVLPAHVVDVDDLPVGIEVEDAVDRLPHELHVVRDHDEAAGVVLQELPQPDHGVGVQVVGRLVEDHGPRVREEDARQLDAPALTAGQGLQRLIEDAVRKVQVARDRRRLGLRGVSPEHVEALLQTPVGLHGRGGDLLVVARHLVHRLLHPEHDGPEPPRIEDAGARQVVEVAGARVLRQVAELLGALHLAAIREQVAGEDLGQRRLAGAVPADQTDLVAGRDTEAHVLHEQPGSDSELEVLHGKHRRHSIRSVDFARVVPNGCASGCSHGDSGPLAGSFGVSARSRSRGRASCRGRRR